jgi:hypothetical protein
MCTTKSQPEDAGKQNVAKYLREDLNCSELATYFRFLLYIKSSSIEECFLGIVKGG